MLEPTRDLAEALNRFDPLRPLHSADELQSFYVGRAHSPLRSLAFYLKNRKEPAKLLFMGNRGCGKSTELAKLASELDDEFIIAHFHAGQVLNLLDVQPVDVVLGCGLALLQAALEDPGDDEGIWGELKRWLQNDLLPEEFAPAPLGRLKEAGVSLKFVVAEISAKWNAESATRQMIRPRLQTMLSEWSRRINEVIQVIRERRGKMPLILVEDLDKTALPQAQRVFFQEGRALRLLDCHVVYTFPIALRYSNDFPQIKQNFEHEFKLPNIKINNRDGSPDPEGRATLRDLVLRRAEASLFHGTALEHAIELSGGLVVDLVRLIQGAILQAIVNEEAQVTRERINEVAAEIRSDYRALLRPDQYEALRKAGEQREWVNEDVRQESLHNLSLLEYRNSEIWCDVHPIVRPLLNPILSSP